MMVHTLLTILLVAIAASNAAKLGKTKKNAGNYETVTPVVTYEDDTLPYPLEMNIQIPTANVTYTLILTLNEMVMSRNFKSVVVGRRGNKVDRTHYLNCYYQGEVEGYPDWTASISTCHGLQGTFGNHEDDGTYYNLRPLDKKNAAIDQLHALHLNDDTEDGGSCGTGKEHSYALPSSNSTTKGSRTRRQSSNTRFVEWVLVNDLAQFRALGSDLQNTVQRAITIANGVDNIFRQLNIRVILRETITFTSSDRFPVSSNPNTALNSFTDYVRSDILSTTQYDSIMLMTGNDFDGSTIGIAFIGTMCRLASSTGLTQDGLRSLSSVISTAAHELGHIFNMNHDDGRGCSCAANQCVMSASLGFPPPTFWSSCSVSDLNVLYSRGGDSCLFNIPDTTVGDPVCGNGIVEENEECDCGSPSECTNPCCNAATCQPIAGAECASGTCCTSQCALASYGTECRASSGDCDIAEYCLGDFNECPDDDVVADGVSCESDTGYCSEGSCPTLDGQCADSFGSAAGVTQCFDQNTRGDQFGYCEQSDGRVFTPCASNDVMCGQLRCMDGSYTGAFGNGGTITTFTLQQGICRAFVSNDPANLNAGLVTDGTRCGDGWVCDSRRCVQQTDTTSCPVGANNAECSGSSNGVSEQWGQSTNTHLIW